MTGRYRESRSRSEVEADARIPRVLALRVGRQLQKILHRGDGEKSEANLRRHFLALGYGWRLCLLVDDAAAGDGHFYFCG